MAEDDAFIAANKEQVEDIAALVAINSVEPDRGSSLW